MTSSSDNANILLTTKQEAISTGLNTMVFVRADTGYCLATVDLAATVQYLKEELHAKLGKQEWTRASRSFPCYRETAARNK